MILGFLGKGGSGKSSVSTQMALFLNAQQNTVLAIDADHNMDLSYNLSGGEIPEINYFSQSQAALQEALGLADGERYPEAFLRDLETRFTLSPLTKEIENFSVLLENDIRLMVAGPQTDSVLHGAHCSHRLTTALKILLPLMSLRPTEAVVVDEKAGADGVSTGIVTGIDVGVIVCEPALHSVKTAKQIAELMDFYKTPYVFMGNKVSSSEDKDFISTELGEEPTVFLMESFDIKRNPASIVSEWQDELGVLLSAAEGQNKNNRLERTIEKFRRNLEFQSSH